MRPPTHLALLAAASLSLAAACASNQPAGRPAGSDTGVVTHLVDGDTLDVRIDGRTERIRLIGVDTPESVAPNRPVQCYGAEASTFLATLVPEGTEVRLERDVVARDDYDRLLAYVYRADDDLLVNLALVEQGYADAVTYGDNEALYPTLAAAEADARAAGRGLWGVCGGPDVDLPDQ
ncbi:MAG: thermonuclease family protein [Acidimicrobiia bacterium]